MAVNCGVSFGVCAVRVTTVDVAGNVTGTSNNSLRHGRGYVDQS